jgi:N-acetylmuramoyl-L-alanine amidase
MRDRFTAKWTPTDELFSATIDSSNSSRSYWFAEATTEDLRTFRNRSGHPQKDDPTCVVRNGAGPARKKILHKGFAPLSPVFAVAALACLLVCGIAEPASRAKNSPAFSAAGDHDADAAEKISARHEAAAAQFGRAEEQRAALNAKAADRRTLADYKQVVASYRRVYLITPRAAEVQDALLAAGELYAEMGDHFGRTYYQSAVDSYQFLLREYPSSKYREDALLRVGKLQRDQLGDAAGAMKTYEDFLKKYPGSAHKLEAQEALAEMALLQHGEEAAANAGDSNASAKESATNAIIGSTGNSSRGISPATRERSANANPTTRENANNAPSPRSARAETVATDSADIVPGPVSGGMEAARSGSQGAPRIRRITTNANTDGTRIIIDLEDTVAYTSARIRNPDRIFFDLHTARLTPEMARGAIEVSGDLLSAVRVAQNQAGVVRVVLNVSGVKDYAASLISNPPRLVIFLYSDTRRSETARAAKIRDGAAAEAGAGPSGAGDLKTVSANADVDPSMTPTGDAGSANPTSTGKNARARSLTASAAKPDLIRPLSTPQPTRDGQSTLTRALGLKIGRIVIDAGHGGHDTGTIGPTGLMEKDLCLDVALRLGKIIQQRLPGADIVYTRSDDTFIPLEERTNIANQARADLFVSIHANSSPDHAARGVETYYLNLKGSAEAMEVAARENASSDEGVHDLQDLVAKIARNEKIDESKDFAEDIQDSLAKRMQKASKTVRDRGVKKAPFVVLIGADMPSILSEISFLSNAADEKLLKQPEYRQRVAEGLYQGIASYLQSMNSMTMNEPSSPAKNAARGSAAAAPVEQSRNQR